MKIALLGDIALNGIINSEPEKNDFRYDKVSLLLKSNNLVFANLETPIKTNDEKNENKKHTLFTEKNVTIDILSKLNVKCVSLANNHIFDFKFDGLKSTIEVLDNLNVFHTGAGWLDEHIQPVIIQRNGLNIGFIAYVDYKTNPGTEFFPNLKINYLDIEKIKKDINYLRARVDKVICSIHWGEDYSFYPNKDQIFLAHQLIDLGIDIIMGHHPHTLQPYEKYKQGIIFYSLGNFIFGDFWRNGELLSLYRKTKKSIVAEINLTQLSVNFISTKELKGNRIVVISRDYNKWSKIKWRLFSIKEFSTITKWLFNFYEKIIYRIYEYFFGYYHNPFKRLLFISNIKKIKNIYLTAFKKI